jgi:hypothetical protein
MVDRIESESYVVSAQLTKWPEDMFARPQLRSCVLMRNQLSAADEQLTRLTMLEVLNLKSNRFESVDVIVDCASLVSLDMGYNRLAALPHDIGARLPHLQSLKLDANLFVGPQSIVPICGISTLTHLTLQSNALRTLPQPEIGRLSRLELLDLRSTELTELPDALFDLCELRFLRLQRNALRRLPPRIGALTRLNTLAIENNQLTSLPCTLVHIAELNFLSVNSNRLTTLPAAIGELPLLFLDFVANPYTDAELVDAASIRAFPQRRSETVRAVLRGRARGYVRCAARLLCYARLLLTTPLVRHFVRGRGDLVALPPHVLRDILDRLAGATLAAIDEATNNAIVEFATVRPIARIDAHEFARRILFSLARAQREEEDEEQER